MRRNFYAVLFISALFGLTFGMYELVLPFYLEKRGFSDMGQGLIFAVGLVIPFFLRIGVGSISDRAGRKVFYALSILLAGAASIMTPFFAGAAMQAVAKGMRESAVEIKRVLHPILLYEFAKRKFIDFMGKTQGFERLFEAPGYPLAGLLIACFGAAGYCYSFALSGLLLLVGFIVFTAFYSEPDLSERKNRNGPPSVTIRQIFSLRLNRKLWIIIGSSMIFNIGLLCSHCFVMQLFFVRKFGLTEGQTSWVLMLHRLFMAVPLIFAGRILRGGVTVQKFYYIIFVFVEGVLIVAGGLIPNFWWATILWLLHDLFGAGVWLPAQAALAMHYTRDDLRGTDFGKVVAFSSVTMFLGPLLAGYLTSLPGVSAAVAISLPFIVGGGTIAFSAAMLLLL